MVVQYVCWNALKTERSGGSSHTNQSLPSNQQVLLLFMMAVPDTCRKCLRLLRQYAAHLQLLTNINLTLIVSDRLGSSIPKCLSSWQTLCISYRYDQYVISQQPDTSPWINPFLSTWQFLVFCNLIFSVWMGPSLIQLR